MKLAPVIPSANIPSANRRFAETYTSANPHECCTAPVRAIAVAHERSNAVGTVELCCTQAGLLLQFVRVCAYNEGYVPYPATSSERFVVPYEQVAKVEVDGDGLVHLTLDPSCTPFNRMALAGLAKDLKVDHATCYRRRARIQRNVTMAALIACVPIMLVLRFLFPNFSVAIMMGLSLSACLVLHLLRGDIASKWVMFNSKTELARDELLGELRLRLAPGAVRSTFAIPAALTVASSTADATEERQETEAGSLRGLFATAGVMAAVTAVAILIGKNLLFSSPPAPQAMWQEPTQENARPASDPLTNADPVITRDSTPVVPPPPPCICDRADSPLWSNGVPRMSILAHNRAGTTSVDKPSVYPEIAVVNNSSEDLKDIVMVVDFLLGPKDGRKARIVDKQDLFWEGILAPGKAVKWRVRGRGDDFSVTSFVEGSLGQEAKPAPADAFYKLSMTANTPSVRVHGTMMLAYLGDERVAEGLEKLRNDGLGTLENTAVGDAVQQIANASQPLRVCSIQSNPDPTESGRLVVSACVFNASPTMVSRPWIEATATFDSVSSDARWPLRDDLPPKTGLMTTGTIRVPVTDDPVDPKSAIVHVEAGK